MNVGIAGDRDARRGDSQRRPLIGRRGGNEKPKRQQAAKGDETILKLAGQVRQSATANTKAICYWEYYCYYKGWCEYAYVCPDGMQPLRPAP